MFNELAKIEVQQRAVIQQINALKSERCASYHAASYCSSWRICTQIVYKVSHCTFQHFFVRCHFESIIRWRRYQHQCHCRERVWHLLQRRILAKARQVSVEQKKLRALMADAGVTDATQLPSPTSGPKVLPPARNINLPSVHLSLTPRKSQDRTKNTDTDAIMTDKMTNRLAEACDSTHHQGKVHRFARLLLCDR